MGFPFWVCVALFAAMTILFLPFFILRTVRMLVDHYAERLLATGVNFTTQQVDRIELIRKSRETAGNQLSRLPAWMQRLAAAKFTGTIVDLLWKVLCGRLRLPVLLASWTYLAVLLILSCIGIVTLSISSGLSLALLAVVTYCPGVILYVVSNFTRDRLCPVASS